MVQAPGKARVAAQGIDAASLPADLRALFREAAQKEQLVLVEFSGPG